MKKMRKITALLMVLALLTAGYLLDTPIKTAKAETGFTAPVITGIEIEGVEKRYYATKDKNNLTLGSNYGEAGVWIHYDNYEEDPEPPTIEWSVDKPSIVKLLGNVEDDPLSIRFKARKQGKAKLTVKVTDTNGKVFTASKTITVKKTNKKIKYIGIGEGGRWECAIQIGEVLYTDEIIWYEPVSAYYNNLTVKSSNPKVAAVKKDSDKRTYIIGKKKGKVTITVKSSNGKRATFKVRVVK